MSTPTPRTDDEQWTAGYGDAETVVWADFARTLERELAIETERATHYRDEWQKERAKVRTLRDACDRICEEWGRNHDANPIGAGQRMSTMAGKALEKLEQDEENS
tara:strand:- start:319 stop:633 length:315 start_codon:yes stop_codon:yes gene_type:complete